MQGLHPDSREPWLPTGGCLAPGPATALCPPADLATKGMGVHSWGRVASPQAFLASLTVF